MEVMGCCLKGWRLDCPTPAEPGHTTAHVIHTIRPNHWPSHRLLRAATDLGWTIPTPVQVQAMPAILRAQTYKPRPKPAPAKPAPLRCRCLQALQGQAPNAPRRVRALVLVPTRELAAQVGEVLRSLAQHLPTPLKVAVVFGGVSINPQMMGLRGGADVVVATPGRLLDLVNHNALKLGVG